MTFRATLRRNTLSSGEIGRPHGAVTEFPVKAVWALLYLEVAED